MKTRKTLHIVCKKNWYQMEESGEKPEDYREITSYWIKRLCRYGNGGFYGVDNNCINGGCPFKMPSCTRKAIPTDVDKICIHYGRTARCMTFECNGIYIGRGVEKWGAPADRKVFILKLGKRV